MRVFDERRRVADWGSRYVECDFDYLNRSGRIPMAEMRNTVEDWWAKYPTEHQGELRKRLRARDNQVHRGAFFELALFTIFRSAGLVLEVHPAVGDSLKHPDFCLRNRRGDLVCYLEATRASGLSAAAAAAERRANHVYDILDSLDSPDYFVGLEIAGAPTAPPRASAIRRLVSDGLAASDFDEVNQLWRANLEMSGWTYEEHGWRVRFFPIPKHDEDRAEPGIRPLGMFVGEALSLSPAEDIRAALSRKLPSRYGTVDAPYVIAVNACAMAADRRSCVNALFGSPTVAIPERGGIASARAFRKANGFWFGGAAPRNTSVSGVLFADYTHPSQIASADLCLLTNPWAKSLCPELPRITRIECQAGQPVPDPVEGDPIHVLLGIGVDFPGRDPD